MIRLWRSERRLPSGEVTPLDPQTAQWYERVNSGARFRLNFAEEMLGPRGAPYLRLPLAGADEEGHTFAELALFLYNRNIGGLLTLPQATEPNEADQLYVSLGDIVDFLQTGRMQDRVPCTPPWGYPDNYPEDYQGPLHEPGMVILPVNVRQNMAWVFKQIGSVDVRVSLFKAKNGLQSLWIVYKTKHELAEEQEEAVATRCFWCLPRYYAVLVSSVEEAFGIPFLTEESD